jgi:drug/metabolite transporter (DMT)-like permease
MKSSLTHRTRSIVGLTLAVFFWGASFVATKLALREITPAMIVFVRFAIGILLLVSVAAWRRDRIAFQRKELPALALLAFLGITFHQWLQANGLKSASATVTSWIVATTPVFVALLGWLALGEGASRLRVIGILLAGIGALIVVSKGDLNSLFVGRIGTAGDVLITISAINWAVFTVGSKRWLERQDSPGGERSLDDGRPLRMIISIMIVGWLIGLPWFILDGGWEGLVELSLAGWGALIFLGVASSGLAYLFWYDALDKVDATQAGAFLYLEPLVTMTLAGPLLGEIVHGATIVGGACILAGLWLVNRY